MKKKRILSIGLCALMIACAQPVWAEEAQVSETEMEETQVSETEKEEAQVSEAEAEEPQIPDAEAEETETPAVQAEEASAVAQSLVVSPSADITVGETVTLEGTAATEGEPEAGLSLHLLRWDYLAGDQQFVYPSACGMDAGSRRRLPRVFSGTV